MEYYKIIKDNIIMGIADSSCFIRYSAVNDCWLYCNKSQGQYIISNEKTYRDSWMKPLSVRVDAIDATIMEIEEEEYNILFEAFKTEETIAVEEPEEPIPEIPDTDDPDITVEFVRSAKLKEISAACRHAIENGIDLIIRGETKHFSLTAQDQLNLMDLKTLVETEDFIPYHADNEEQMFYTAAEIKQIIAAASAHKIYQTTYHNALKAYVNSLETIEEISAITYGISIPEEYKTEVLKTLKTE